MMRSIRVLAAAAVLLSACASGPSRESAGNQPTAPSVGSGADSRGLGGLPQVVPSTTCPADLNMGGMPYGQGEKVTEALKVSWVLRCRFEQQNVAGDGTWNVVITERADGSPDALLKALKVADLPIPSGIACPAIGYVLPWFVLVDDKGKPHFAHIPTGTCGQPSPEALSALNALPFRVIKTERTSRVQSELSVRTGCSDQWKDVIALTIAGPSRPSGTGSANPSDIDPGFTGKGTAGPASGTVPASGSVVATPTPVPPLYGTAEPVDPPMTGKPPVSIAPGSMPGSAPDAGSGGGSIGSVGTVAAGGSASAGSGTVDGGVVATTVVPPSPPAPHLCVYKSDQEAGTLTRGRALQAGELSTLLKGMSGPVHPCGIRHTTFAVFFGADSGDWSVELDGCTRSLSSSGVVGQASDAALAILRK